MYKIKFTKNALLDILNIEIFISNNNPDISKQVKLKLLEIISNLAIFPNIWKQYKKRKIREHVDPNYNYRILYEVDEKQNVIKILNIFKYKNF